MAESGHSCLCWGKGRRERTKGHQPEDGIFRNHKLHALPSKDMYSTMPDDGGCMLRPMYNAFTITRTCRRTGGRVRGTCTNGASARFDALPPACVHHGPDKPPANCNGLSQGNRVLTACTTDGAPPHVLHTPEGPPTAAPVPEMGVWSYRTTGFDAHP